MAKKPANDFTHKVVSDANYYRRVPKEGDKPAGVFPAGTRVKLLDSRIPDYRHVQSEELHGHRITAWVQSHNLALIFKPTHETTMESAYWLKANGPPTRPPDGSLPARTGVLVLGVDDAGTGMSNRFAHVQWREDGDVAFIDIQKTPLRPL